MNRFVSSGLILTVLLVVLVGRSHFNNVSTGLAMPVFDAISVVGHVQNQISNHYYQTQTLVSRNQDINQPPPDQFQRKSSLLKRVEVFPGGIIYIQFTAENRGQPVELVYTPTIESRYRLSWACSSYNLTQQWRDALHEVCTDTESPFDAEAFARQQREAQAANDYIERVASAQRDIKPATAVFDCSAIAEGSNDFLQVDGNQISYWTLGDSPRLRFRFPRPPEAHQTAYWALGDTAYVYQGNRLTLYRADSLQGEPTQINLMDAYRLRRTSGTLLANSGVGLTRLDLCHPQPKVQDNYLLELGAYNQIQDFLVQDQLVFLTALEANRSRTYSALQIVSLRSNRPVGFLKLEGSSRGIALNGRLGYVANGPYGIAVIDLFDLTTPRLLSRVTTMDFASDLLVRDDHLILADRLAGLKVYRLNGETLQLTQEIPTPEAALQIKALQEPYLAVSFKNGSSGLYQWINNKVMAVELDSQ